MSEISNDLFWFDEVDDLIASLNLLNQQLDLLETDHRRWKWVIVSLFSCIQSAMILCLRSTNYFHILRSDSLAEWKKLHTPPYAYQPKKPPKMDYFEELLKKVQDKELMTHTGNEQCLTLNATQKKQIHRLKAWRDEFIHYLPSDWGISISEFVYTIGKNFKLLHFLLTETRNCYWNTNKDKDAVDHLIETIGQKINALASLMTPQETSPTPVL
ncbi:MAG: hypothetical protein AB7P76_05455 [Candidatus Melainabacteria bacterium]